MNDQDKATFKKFLKNEGCYKSFKKYYNSKRNSLKRMPLRTFLNKERIFYNALFNAFAWLHTVEGWKYWANLYTKLLKL